MSDFKQILNALVAGMDSFEFVPANDILVFPDRTQLRIAEFDIQLKSGKSWFTGFAVNDSLSYQEPVNLGGQGSLYQLELKGMLPHDHYEMAEYFFANQFTDFVVKYIDRGGVRRILGSPEEPLRLSFDYALGGSPADRKG